MSTIRETNNVQECLLSKVSILSILDKNRVITGFNRIEKKRNKKINTRPQYSSVIDLVLKVNASDKFCLGCDATNKKPCIKKSYSCRSCNIDAEYLSRFAESIMSCQELPREFKERMKQRYDMKSDVSPRNPVRKSNGSKKNGSVASTPEQPAVQSAIELPLSINTKDESDTDSDWEKMDDDDDDEDDDEHDDVKDCDTTNQSVRASTTDSATSDSASSSESLHQSRIPAHLQVQHMPSRALHQSSETEMFEHIFYDRQADLPTGQLFNDLCKGMVSVHSSPKYQSMIKNHISSIRDPIVKSDFIRAFASKQSLIQERTRSLMTAIAMVENCYLPGDKLRPHQILTVLHPHLCPDVFSPDVAMSQATGEGKTLAGLLRTIDLLMQQEDLPKLSAWVTVPTVLEQHLTVVLQVLAACRLDHIKVFYVGDISKCTMSLLRKEELAHCTSISFRSPDLNGMMTSGCNYILMGQLPKVKDCLKNLKGIHVKMSKMHLLDQPKIQDKVRKLTQAKLIAILIDEYDYLRTNTNHEGNIHFDGLVSGVMVNYETMCHKVWSASDRVALIKISATLGVSDYFHPFDRQLEQPALIIRTDPQPIVSSQVTVIELKPSRDFDTRIDQEVRAILTALRDLNGFSDYAYIGASNRRVAEILAETCPDVELYQRGQKQYNQHVVNWGCHRAIDVINRNVVISFSTRNHQHQSFEHLIGRARRGQDIQMPKFYFSESAFNQHQRCCTSVGKLPNGEPKPPICDRQFPDVYGKRLDIMTC